MPIHPSIDGHVKKNKTCITTKYFTKERRPAKVNKTKADTDAHKELLKTTIETWAEVDMAALTFDDISGRSETKTFRVTAPGEADPKTVILHLRKVPEAEKATAERVRDAQKALSETCGPARLSAEDAFEVVIEADSGIALAVEKTHKDMAELLASVHKVEPAWFDAYKAVVGEKHACLAEAVAGSPIWWFTLQPSMLEGYDEEKLKAFAEDMYEPLSEAGKKVVSCHGDFHRENCLQKADGTLQVVDLGFAYAGWAALDIAYHFIVTPLTPVQKKEFVLAYLKGMGQEEENEEETNKLLYDAEMQGLRVAFQSKKLLTLNAMEADKKYDGNVWTHMKAYEEKSREDAALQTSIVNNGAWVAATNDMDEAFKKDWKKWGKLYQGGGGGCCNCSIF